MAKQVMIDDKVYNKLQFLKETYNIKGMGKVIDRCIDTYIDTYKNPKQVMINELTQIIDKYHYLFNTEEKEYLALFIGLIRADSSRRIAIVETLYNRVCEDNKKQLKLE